MVFENHASEEQLEEYSRGTLSTEEVEVVEEHLLVCPRCQDRLAELDAFVDAARQAAARMQIAPPTTWEDYWRGASRWMWRPAPAITFACLIAGAVIAPRIWQATDPNQAVYAVRLQSMRGAAEFPNASAPADRPLELTLDLTGLPERPSYRVEIVDRGGSTVFETAVRRDASEVKLRVPKRLHAAQHWVRLYDPQQSGALLREYGLEVN